MVVVRDMAMFPCGPRFGGLRTLHRLGVLGDPGVFFI